MSPDPPDPQRILHYRIVRPLGAGGMGEVFLAEDERLGRRVALKFLPRADSADPERRERLRREARALASLSHPGIAAVHALEEQGDRLFLVMEYIEGETLAERLARRPLPVAETIERGLVVAEALAHAHGRGVIHRDIKPSNILITPEGATKLADFGLALLEGETRLTMEGTSAGTADHMSPEQTRGAALDARSDLFSLGVVLYESLTGVRPFARPSLEATFHAVRADDPEPPTALRSGIPLELERIVMKLIRKDPGERYASSADLATDLRALRARESRVAELPTATSPVERASTSYGRPAPTTAHGPRLSRVLLWTVPALLVLAGLLYVLGVFKTKDAGRAEAGSQSIAVLQFRHMAEPSDSSREAAMAASLLTVGLAQTQTIPVLSNQRVSDVLEQMGQRGPLTGADALEAGRRTGATYVVTGFIYQTSPNYVLGAEVASTATGSVLASCRVEAPGGEHGLFAAVDTLTMALRDGLAKSGIGVRDASADVASQTTRNPAAYRAYLRGIDQLGVPGTDAAEAFEQAVRADSTFALAWYYLAVAKWWGEDFDGAKQAIDVPLRLGNRLAGREREALTALRGLVQGQFSDAAQEYRTLLDRYPNDKEFLYGLGEALVHEGRDPDGAMAALKGALGVDPTFSVAYQHVVDIHLDRRRYDAALADIERFEKANPGSPVIRHLRFEVLGRSGQIERMLAFAREVQATPSTWRGEAAYRLSTYFRMVGEFDSAAFYIRQMAPGRSPGIFLPADIYLLMSQGRWREADAESHRRLHGTSGLIPREDFETALALIRILVHERKNAEAWELLRRMQDTFMAFHPNSGAALEMTGVFALRMGRRADTEEALRQFDVILHQNPYLQERRSRDGLALELALARGDAREAMRLLPTAGSGSPPEIQELVANSRRSQALALSGDLHGSMEALERVVRIAPYAGDPFYVFPAMVELANRYEQSGRRDDALALYRRLAHQFRAADPRSAELEAARAGIARIERRQAQAGARR